MSITFLAAQDEVFGIVNTAFAAAVGAQSLDETPQLIFPGTLVDPPSPDEIYATVGYAVVTEDKAGIGQAGGISLYESNGLLTVSLYAPKQIASSLRVVQQMGEVLRDAFRSPSPSSEVWFTKARCTPVGGNTTMNQVNVVVVCTYKTEK